MARTLSSLALLVLASACSSRARCDEPPLAPLDRTPGFAVVLSDYASTAVALLDGEGETITEAWLDSGTRASDVSPGLSGDVVPVDPPRPGTLALLERWNADRLTLATLANSELRQIDLRGDDPFGHSPNAQDVLAIDARHVLVARANPSFHPETPELARGNDVVVVDLEAGAILSRIDLEADAQLEDGTIAYARPTSMVMLERGAHRRVVVGLQGLDESWRVSGPGAVSVVDPDARRRELTLPLEGLSGCHFARAVPGAPDRAMVLCTGDAFTPEVERRREAGIVRLVLDQRGDVRAERVWRAAEHPEAPSPTTGLVPLDASRAVFVSDPRADGGVDVLTQVDLDAGSTVVVLEAEASFVLGSGAFDPERGLLLVPDAATRAVHRLDLRAGRVEPRDSLPLPSCRTLPPREIRRL